jgi:hypothetical protein
MPPLRPAVGFCIQTESTGTPPGRWFINMTRHKMVDMPVAYSGRPVSREFILSHGIGNMQVPFDIGTFRKLKERAEGAKQTTYCVDVVFNPLIIQLFMDDEFCNADGLQNFRTFVMNLALKRIEESIGVKLSLPKAKLVKAFRYKDGEDGEQDPREFTELPGDADCFDEEAPKKPAKEEPAQELIQDVTPGKPKKPAVKKGFLNTSSKSLYGPEGSKEGVVPENAGDPMGFIPKKLRQTCKFVDTAAPEYQEAEKKRRSAEEHNATAQEFRDTLTKDLDKWTRHAQPDKWESDLPDAGPPPCKYDNDYSRFNDVGACEDEAVAAPTQQRDWYCDGDGKVQRVPSSSSKAPAPTPEPAPPAAEPALKKGFLDGGKSPLYPKGSEQRAPPTEEQIMKDMANLMGVGGSEARQGTAEKKPSVAAKVPECKAPEFTLSEEADNMRLTVSVPRLESMQGVSLDVTEQRASLAFPGGAGLKPLQVELPVAVVPTGARAKFSKKRCEIAVTLPLAAH